MKNSICETVEDEVEELSVHPYSKSELARAYAPEIGSKPSFALDAPERRSLFGFVTNRLSPYAADFYLQTSGIDF